MIPTFLKTTIIHQRQVYPPALLGKSVYAGLFEFDSMGLTYSSAVIDNPVDIIGSSLINTVSKHK